MHDSPKRIAFHVAYDGTAYHGWQRQPSGLNTIQGTLDAALSDLLKQPVSVDGASRTDAGVHARDQLAAVTYTHPMPAKGLVKALNTRLPDDIAVRHGVQVAGDFNPRFANQGKTYCYRFYEGPVRRPLIDRFAWRVGWTLDLPAMTEAGQALVGTHDFTSFAASDGSHQSAERTIHRLHVDRGPWGTVELVVEGKAFLKQMVRNIAGTLLEVGRGHRPPTWVADALAAHSRSAAGPTAPACGLVLEKMHLEGPLAESGPAFGLI
ncbi:MAG: tRNA pseudouridine(38-40) synthase TruA [Bradymonadia bacterium]